MHKVFLVFALLALVAALLALLLAPAETKLGVAQGFSTVGMVFALLYALTNKISGGK